MERSGTGSEYASASAATPFIGRDEQLRRLEEHLDRESSSTTLVVSGEQGIGKTRLVTEFAARARLRSMAVVGTRAWLQGAEPAYWHWNQVFTTLLPDRHGTTLEDLILDHGGSNRLDLFDEAATILARSAEDQPLLIILDDLHAAGAPTLLLTRFLGEQLSAHPVSIVATSRPSSEIVDSATRFQLDALLAESDQIELAGLSADEVASMVASVEVVRELHSATGGNPLFIEQFVKYSARPSAAHEATVDGLAALTALRIARLGDDTRMALCALAVLGGRASRAELAAVLAMDEADVDGALEATAGDAVRKNGADGFAFAHTVFATASYAPGPATERMHLRAAELVTDAPGREIELAQHLARAGTAGAHRAPLAFVEAGDAAAAALGYEKAVDLYSTAIDLLTALPAAPIGLRVRSHIGLARAASHLGDHDAARTAFDEAWSVARAADPELVAEAALGPELGFGFVPDQQPHRAARCQEALDRLGSEHPALRARLLAALATHQLATADLPTARATAVLAHELAVACDDGQALGASLVALSVTDLGPDTMDHRVTMARQTLSLADTLEDQPLARTGHFLLLAALLERGDVRAVDAELASRRRESARFEGLESTRHILWFRCMRAILDGRITESEQLAAQALDLAGREGDADALSVYVGQLGIIRWMQGRENEVESMYTAARQAQPGEAVWTAVLARLWALDGRLQAAQGAISSLGDLTAITRDRNWLLTIVTLAEAAAIVGDRAAAATLRTELLPYAHRLVPIGLGIACWGTVARPLALLCALLDLTDEAVTHFRTAISVCSDAGAQPWLAQAQCELTDLIYLESPEEASALLGEAESTVNRLGLVALEQDCVRRRERQGLGDRQDASNPAPAAIPADRPLVRVLGTFEVVGLGGRPASWTSRKARELLKLLVSRRGAPVTREAIMDALWPDEDPRALSNRLSVALTTVRRAFDPDRSTAYDQFLESDNRVIRLRTDTVLIDAEQFLAAAHTALRDTSGSIEPPESAVNAFLGAALDDEPYAGWAVPFRQEVHSAFARVARELAERAEDLDDQLLAADTYRRLLVEDPFDEHAHRGLVRTLTRLGAHGRAQAAERDFTSRMTELGLDIEPSG